jgi:hypothetical protein
VQGGLTIHSGGLTLSEQSFRVGDLSAVSSPSNNFDPLISAAVTSSHYAGNIVEATAAASASGDADMTTFMNFYQQSSPPSAASAAASGASTAAAGGSITMSTAGRKSVFRVKGSGHLQSDGGAVFRGKQGLEVHGRTQLRGNLVLTQVQVVPQFLLAEDEHHQHQHQQGQGVKRFVAAVPATANYVSIAPADRSALLAAAEAAGDLSAAQSSKSYPVELVFSTTSTGSAGAGTETGTGTEAGDPGNVGAALAPGRVLVVCNRDSRTTTGAAAVPPGSTVLLVFDGAQWISIDALTAPTQVNRRRKEKRKEDVKCGDCGNEF